MSSTNVPPRSRKRPTGLRRWHRLVADGWITNQHGSWAMTVIPLIVGTWLSGPAPLQGLLAFAWMAAFFFFGALTLWIKVYASARKRAGGKLPEKTRTSVHRRQRKYLPALATYGLLAGASGTCLLLLRPELLVWAPAFAGLFGLALYEMVQFREHGLVARVSAVLASQLLTPIAYSLGADPHDWARAWLATVVLSLYFVGTVPYVKTLIRERGERTWLNASVGFHAAVFALFAALSATGELSWWITGFGGLLLLRAAGFPALSARREKPLRPAVIGIAEFGVSAVAVLVLVLPATLS